MKQIITSTGFCLPANQYYTPFAHDNVIADEIFNRSLIKSSDYTLAAYFRDNEIYTSTTVNNLYNEYRVDPSYKNFMLLVDLASEIFTASSFLDFITWQMTNPYASATTVMFCADLVNGKLSGMSIYGNTPYNSRFNVNTTLTNEKIRQSVDALAKKFQKEAALMKSSDPMDTRITTWVELFSRLMKNRNDFLSFYRYVLCDYY